MSNIIKICHPSIADKDLFIKSMQASKSLHHPWVDAPSTETAFENYLKKYRKRSHLSYLIKLNTHIVGIININEIVRGCFQSAYLGFYANIDYAGKGYMSQGLKLVLKAAFEKHKLHRLEANIQPDNIKSIQLVKKNNFHKEGFSPRYLYINNEWRDHERWAITVEDWERQN